MVEIGNLCHHNQVSLQKPIPICGVVQQDWSCSSALLRLRRSIPKTSFSHLLPHCSLYTLYFVIFVSLPQRQIILGFCTFSLQVTNPIPPMADHPAFKQLVAQVFQNQVSRPTTVERSQDEPQKFDMLLLKRMENHHPKWLIRWRLNPR